MRSGQGQLPVQPASLAFLLGLAGGMFVVEPDLADHLGLGYMALEEVECRLDRRLLHVGDELRMDAEGSHDRLRIAVAEGENGLHRRQILGDGDDTLDTRSASVGDGTVLCLDLIQVAVGVDQHGIRCDPFVSDPITMERRTTVECANEARGRAGACRRTRLSSTQRGDLTMFGDLFTKLKSQGELLMIGGFFVAWILLQTVILPMFGVQT